MKHRLYSRGGWDVSSQQLLLVSAGVSTAVVTQIDNISTDSALCIKLFICPVTLGGLLPVYMGMVEYTMDSV